MSDDISQDILSNIRIIADFLNKPLSDDLAKLSAEQSTFKGLMKNVQSFLLENKEVQIFSKMVWLVTGRNASPQS